LIVRTQHLPKSLILSVDRRGEAGARYDMAAEGVLSVDEDVVEDKGCILRLSLLLGMMQSRILGAQAKLEVLTCLFVV
jgi:hypothetical protein